MNRRDFLVRMLGTSAALAVFPEIETIARASSPAVQDAERWMATYRRVHEEAARLFAQKMRATGLPIGAVAPFEGMRAGMSQFSVDNRRADDRWIEPGMYALASRAADAGLDAWSALRVALPGTAYAAMIGPLRMVSQYNIEFDTMLSRFDVMGSASEAGQRIAQRRVTDCLKSHIRRRLGTYPVRPIPV